jgi:hypothetical protein
LEQALKEAGVKNPASVTKLSLAGMFTDKDFEYIRENMAETLQELDLGDACGKNNKIPDFAFNECTGLTSVVIHNSVSEIGFLAFNNCSGLTSIMVYPGNPACTSDHNVLFNKDKTELIFCTKGQQGAYIIPDSVVEIATRAFPNCDGLTSVTIPGSVATIGFCAFAGCTGLTSVEIPDSVTVIRGFAFVNCSGLTYVTIPRSVIEIGENLFAGCYDLNSVLVHPDNPKYSSEYGILFNKEKTGLIFSPKNFHGNAYIPDSVVKIGAYAFSDCYGLTSVTIPDSVLKVGKMAFAGCTGLTAVTIPRSVLEIGDTAFGDNTFITVHPDNPFYKSENGKLTEKF